MKSSLLLAPPVAEPVSLAEVKLFARLSDTGEDELLQSLIIAAREWCEAYTGRVFIHQSWSLWIKGRPKSRLIRLNPAPLASLTRVQFMDEKDEATLIDPASYFADTRATPGFFVLMEGASWPERLSDETGLVIDFIAGYGPAAEDVPAPLRLAIRQLALFWYEHRGDLNADMSLPLIPPQTRALLSPYRLIGMGAI